MKTMFALTRRLTFVADKGCCNLRLLSFHQLKNATEIKEISLGLHARKFFISLRMHDQNHFVKLSELTNYKRCNMFLNVEEEVPKFLENLELASQLKSEQMLEQNVSIFDEITKIQFRRRSEKNQEFIDTFQSRFDGSIKKGIRIEPECINKLAEALRILESKSVYMKIQASPVVNNSDK